MRETHKTLSQNTMKSKIYTSFKTVKVRTLHPATVRALLKRNGYGIAWWSANGRISGLSDIHGDIEVKENYIKSHTEVKKIAENYWKNTHTEEVSVRVTSWKGTNIKEVAKVLRKAGLIVSEVDVKDASLVVDNK